MWTSTYTGKESGSDWVQWCLANNFSFGDTNDFPCWLLEVDPAAKILTINNYQDCENIYEKYSELVMPEITSFRRIDFEKIALEYDAVHITKLGEAMTRYTTPYNLYGWDCESTYWLKWSFTDVLPLDQKKFKLNMQEY